MRRFRNHLIFEGRYPFVVSFRKCRIRFTMITDAQVEQIQGMAATIASDQAASNAAAKASADAAAAKVAADSAADQSAAAATTAAEQVSTDVSNLASFMQTLVGQ